MSAAGVYKILRRHGLQTRWERLAAVELDGVAGGLLTERTRKQLRLARQLQERPMAASRPGEVVPIDTFLHRQAQGRGQGLAIHGLRRLRLLRRGAVGGRRGERPRGGRLLAGAVVPTYRQAGHRITRVTVDGGTEFKGAFARVCRELGIERHVLKPRQPWTNGFVERLQGTILAECWRPAFRRTYFVRLKDLQHVLNAYFNFERRHQGYRLQGRVPADLFYGRQLSTPDAARTP